jgi:hypothetical protein
MSFRRGLFFSADGGGNGGGSGGAPEPGTAPDVGAKSGSGTGNAPGTQPDKGTGQNNGMPPGAIVFASEAEYQKSLEEKLKERLDRERKKTEDATKKAADAATADAAKQNGEWQKLAEQREKELGESTKKLQELETVQEKATRYEGSLKKFLETQRAGLPEAITKLLDRLDVADQLEWLAANKDALAKKTPDGVPPTPPADGSADAKKLEEARSTFGRSARSWF